MNLIPKGCHQNVWESLFHLELDWESFYFHAYVLPAGFSSFWSRSRKTRVILATSQRLSFTHWVVGLPNMATCFLKTSKERLLSVRLVLQFYIIFVFSNSGAYSFMCIGYKCQILAVLRRRELCKGKDCRSQWLWGHLKVGFLASKGNWARHCGLQFFPDLMLTENGA